ncbi:GNAT family N-acetyltransferase [uncultured Roseibium sp.]|uniref:GNAT family N-acetyltransferase n=1 Tax=uncultured Roseibium sp. TaxID=1936171 RepID=UPI0032174AD2
MPHQDPEFHIRAATPDDCDGLAGLYRHLIPNDVPADPVETPASCKQMLAHPGLTVLIGIRNGVSVSTCTLIVIPNMTRGGAPYALIENVVTHSDYRGKGFGEQLLKSAFKRAWADGCYKVMLLSGSKNTEAHRFYERIGFETTKVDFEARAPGYPPRMLA